MSRGLLRKIRIVLLRPRHPGNIGAVARVMKNMGLARLVLVDPGEWRTPEALAMAWNSREILRKAEIFPTLHDAVRNTAFLLGTSSREGRRIPMTPRDGVPELLRRAGRNEVSILFGPEDKGLSNEELSICHSHIVIPASPRYPSLNLAQAVAIVAYEIFIAQSNSTRSSGYQKGRPGLPSGKRSLASVADIEGFFSHLRSILLKIGFLDPRRGSDFMGDIRDIFQRSLLNKRDVRILRGILRQIEWYGERT